MATKHERIQFTPSDEAENAIARYIADLWNDKKHRCSRIDALNHFVERGIEDWQRDNRAAQDRYTDAMDKLGHRLADKD